MNPFSRLARALWELKHVQYEHDIVRWAGFTKYVINRKRGAFDSAHAYTLRVYIAHRVVLVAECKELRFLKSNFYIIIAHVLNKIACKNSAELLLGHIKRCSQTHDIHAYWK